VLGQASSAAENIPGGINLGGCCMLFAGGRNNASDGRMKYLAPLRMPGWAMWDDYAGAAGVDDALRCRCLRAAGLGIPSLPKWACAWWTSRCWRASREVVFAAVFWWRKEPLRLQAPVKIGVRDMAASRRAHRMAICMFMFIRCWPCLYRWAV